VIRSRVDGEAAESKVRAGTSALQRCGARPAAVRQRFARARLAAESGA